MNPDVTQPSKPRLPPKPTLTRLSAEALVETIDGPVPIVELVGKVMPVLTRFQDGRLGFRMMREIRELEPESPLLRIRNRDGQVVVVGEEHVFLRLDGANIKASELKVGDILESSWDYPDGYSIPAAAEYATELRDRPYTRGVYISGLEHAEKGRVFGFAVNETGQYFLTFGAGCRAQAELR
jgi:hypothetical protein